MRKVILLIMLVILSVTFVGCEAVTYEDVFLTYSNYVTDQKDDYIDLMDIYNTVNTKIILATVTIKNTIDELNLISTGSGVIYDEDQFYYYVFTNSHVIGADASYDHSISVIDARGDSHYGSLVVYDTNYDLAVVKFRKSLETFVVIDMALENPTYMTRVIVLGHPDGQINAMTLGYYLDMTTITLEQGSIGKVNFPVLKLDVPVQTGSSGSVVIDETYQMVGIIFAGNFVESSNATNYSYAIPVESIYEFLVLHQLMGGETS